MNKAAAKRIFSGLLVTLGIWGSLGMGLAEASTPDLRAKVDISGSSLGGDMWLQVLDDQWGVAHP
ncbi:hypothetical protein [Streptomyces drozdowiczii]|uniref:ABC transporter substrate-binding protein n=1 Tax=Streptomyces drozdowiczii TaxID=202862 RepID=A0ABY6Q158_9ACTN|nr:hypothetical protein [Streptomyces drozdowiczii]MCX0241771.1 hypothetical protein [Streptomyces drozdowiczii]UZK58015.1 hypothetical protein NEH16_31515 [Streptomyces drozdowiczii]